MVVTLFQDYRRYGKSVLDMIPEAFKHPLSLSSAYFTALVSYIA